MSVGIKKSISALWPGMELAISLPDKFLGDRLSVYFILHNDACSL